MQDQNMKPVYYWLDGYWIYDKAEAELMDEIAAIMVLSSIYPDGGKAAPLLPDAGMLRLTP